MKIQPLKIGTKTAKVPVIQGGMGVGISLGNLAGAVAKEGGYIFSLRARERIDERCGIPIPYPTTLPSVL